MPLERVPYTPPHPLSHPSAASFLPEYIYQDPSEANPIRIRDDFCGTRRKLRIGVLGAGITSLCFLHAVEKNLPADSIEIVVFAKEDDVGGVVSLNKFCTHFLLRFPPSLSFKHSWRFAAPQLTRK